MLNNIGERMLKRGIPISCRKGSDKVVITLNLNSLLPHILFCTDITNFISNSAIHKSFETQNMM